jgi:hypothetical protein
MAIRTIAAALAIATTLAACASPYVDAIKVDLTKCQAGDHAACDDASKLSVADQQWHHEQNERAGNIALAIIGGLAVGAAVYGAAHSPPPPPPPRPVFIPPPPIPVWP